MEAAPVHLSELAATAKQLARRLLTIGENRLELLTVELQEERARLQQAVLLTFGVAVFGLLMGLTLTALIVVLAWAYSPVVVLVILTGLYGGTAYALYRQLTAHVRQVKTLAATLDQLRKDRACLEQTLA